MLAMTLMQQMPGLRHALRMLRMVGFDSISKYRIEDFHTVNLELDWWSWCVIQPGNEFQSLQQLGIRGLNIDVAMPPFVFRLAAHERSAGLTFRQGDLRSIRLFHWSCVPTTTMFLLCAGASGYETLVIGILNYLKHNIDLHGEDQSSLRQYNVASLMMIRGAMRRSPESVARRTIQAVRTFYNRLGMQMVNYSHCIYECRRLDLMEGYNFNGAVCIGKLCFGATVSKFGCSPADLCRALSERGAVVDPTATLLSLMPLDVEMFIDASEFGFPLGGEASIVIEECRRKPHARILTPKWKLGHYAYIQEKYNVPVTVDFFIDIIQRLCREDEEEERSMILEWASESLPEYSQITRDDVGFCLFQGLLKCDVLQEACNPYKTRFMKYLKPVLPMDRINEETIKSALSIRERRDGTLRDICEALGVKYKYKKKVKK